MIKFKLKTKSQQKKEYQEGVRSYNIWKRMCDKMERLFKEGRYAKKEKGNKKASKKNKKGR